MKNFYGILFSGVFALSCGALRAQSGAADSKPELPSGPLVNKVGKMDSWEIIYSYADEKKADDPATKDGEKPVPDPVDDMLFAAKIKKATITVTFPFWHIEVMKDKGGTVDQWFDGNKQFLVSPKRGSYARQQVFNSKEDTVDGVLVTFGNYEFPDMGWISPQNFVGVQDIGKQKCYAFTSADNQAWISVETRNPVAWRRGVETRLFHQLAPPSQMLAMPQGILKVKEAINKDTQRIGKPNRPRG
jgi:hypothetical protein